MKNNFTHDACLHSNNYTCFLGLNNDAVSYIKDSVPVWTLLPHTNTIFISHHLSLSHNPSSLISLCNTCSTIIIHCYMYIVCIPIKLQLYQLYLSGITNMVNCLNWLTSHMPLITIDIKDGILWFHFDNECLLSVWGWQANKLQWYEFNMFRIGDIYHRGSLPFSGIAVLGKWEAAAMMPWIMQWIITINASAWP